ncbi:hypothetical protein [Photobacterium leiognathi]|uniref:hypothetical protein n=1 Tax=Photobacterium leiognathi TaxID=553611 RepID=UPI002981F3DE|nr:hypothetical protein [Photobacterium leiognathi]
MNTDTQTTELRERLDLMGVKYTKKNTTEELVALLQSALTPVAEEPKTETNEDKTLARLAKAKEMIYVSVQNLNPSKESWKGETVTIANSRMSEIRCFVPFNCEQAEAIWLPRIVVDYLKGIKFKKVNHIKDTKSGADHTVAYVPEFLIRELPEDYKPSGYGDDGMSFSTH